MLSDEFSQMFREEHRAVRDSVLDLIEAFRSHDREAAAALLGRIAVLTGPHFRYEEESLYPSLVAVFGPEYVDALIDDHDGAIAGARRLSELVASPIGDVESEEGVSVARSLLPHVSDCDGLSLMVERLPEEEVRAVFDARSRSLEADLDLIRWADEVRRRPELAIV